MPQNWCGQLLRWTSVTRVYQSSVIVKKCDVISCIKKKLIYRVFNQTRPYFQDKDLPRRLDNNTICLKHSEYFLSL